MHGPDRALVADDHSLTRRGLSEVLRDMYLGIEVREAHDVPTTLDLVAEGGWNIVLLDARMPGGELVDAVTAIRVIDPAVPVLVITAATELEYVMQSMKAGANGLIHKHRAGDEMIEAIRRVAAGGNYLHPDCAADIAQQLGTRNTLPHERLSGRELDIVRRLALGRTVKEIAGDLAISAKTVATYVGRIRAKTGLGSYVEITRYALQNGLVD